jgi:hypothetical protein
LRPCFMPQRPWDSPFRAFPSRRAVPPSGGLLLPCGFDVDPRPARRLRFVASAFRRAPPGEPRGGSVRAHGATGGWDRASRSRRDRPSPRELPRTARGTTDRSHRARRPTAVPPASKLCSLQESVHATIGTRSELAPEPRDPLAGPLLSWVFALLELAPPRPRVRITAEVPGEPSTPEDTRSVPEVGTRAMTPRPSPSGSSDSVGWPPEPRHRQTLRASAPPLGGAPASLALHPRRAARAARGGRASEVRRRDGGPIFERPVISFRVRACSPGLMV